MSESTKRRFSLPIISVALCAALVAFSGWPPFAASSQTSSSTSQRICSVANVLSGPIGTAALTTDRCDVIRLNQTTTGQTVTVPNPTQTTKVRTLIVVNVGTVSVTIGSRLLKPGASVDLRWNGTGSLTLLDVSVTPVADASRVGDVVISTNQQVDHQRDGIGLTLADGRALPRSGFASLISTFPTITGGQTVLGSNGIFKIPLSEQGKLTSVAPFTSANFTNPANINDATIYSGLYPVPSTVTGVCTVTGVSTTDMTTLGFTARHHQLFAPCNNSVTQDLSSVNPASSNTTAGVVPASIWGYSAAIPSSADTWTGGLTSTSNGLVTVVGKTQPGSRALGRALPTTLAYVVPPGITNRVSSSPIQTSGAISLGFVVNAFTNTASFATNGVNSCSASGQCPFRAITGTTTGGGTIPSGRYLTPLPLIDQYPTISSPTVTTYPVGATAITVSLLLNTQNAGTTASFQAGSLVKIVGQTYMLDAVGSNIGISGGQTLLTLATPLREVVGAGVNVATVANTAFIDVVNPVTVTTTSTNIMALSIPPPSARIQVGDWVGCIQAGAGAYTQVTSVSGLNVGFFPNSSPSSCLNGNNLKKLPFLSLDSSTGVVSTPSSTGTMSNVTAGPSVWFDLTPTSAGSFAVGEAQTGAFFTSLTTPPTATPPLTAPFSFDVFWSVGTAQIALISGPFSAQVWPYGAGDGATTFNIPNLLGSLLQFSPSLGVTVGSPQPALGTGAAVTPRIVGWPFIITSTP